MINIVTYDPLYDKVDNATLESGTQSLTEGNATASAGKAGVYGVRLSASGFRADEFSLPDGQEPPFPHAQNGSLSAEARWRPVSGVEASLEGGVSNENENSDIGFESLYRLRSNDLRAAVAADTRIGTLGLQFYHNQNRVDVFERR